MKNVKKDKLFIFTGFVRAVDPYLLFTGFVSAIDPYLLLTGFVRAVDPYCKLIFFEFSLLNNAWYNKFFYS